MKRNATRRFILSSLITAWSALSFSAFAAPPDTGRYTPDQALSISQAAIGRRVANYTFTDSQGQKVNIDDFLGKPLVVSFIYTGCSLSCPVITQTLAEAALIARDALGEDSFSVISVGFDNASDSPVRMRDFASQQGIDLTGWKFLSGDSQAISGLSENLGFVFSPLSDGFNHLSQVTVIGSDGVVYRQVYGENFESPFLVEPLKELVFGTAAPFSSLGDLIKKVRLFCTIYDPVNERYRFDYSIFIQLIVGFLIIAGLVVFVGREWWRIYRVRSHGAAKPPHQRSPV